MLLRSLPSRIELAGTTRFAVGVLEVGALMVGGAGNGVGGRGWRRCWWLHECHGYPVVEEVAQIGDGGELFMVDVSVVIFDSAQEEVERMDNVVAFGYRWLGEVLV